MTKKLSNRSINNSHSAFSIIELSIVILIISILVSGGLVASKSAINSAKVKITRDRIDLIYKSIILFVANNKRLPCPASLDNSKTNATYGNEAITSGACSAFSSTSATNLSYGMVPVRSLGLPIEAAEDGFGNKFDYIIDKRFAIKYSDALPNGDSFEGTQSSPNVGAATTALNIIKVQGSGTDLMTNAVLILMSHGANGFKAWPASGTAQNTTNSPTANENSNSRDENGNNYDNIFVNFSPDPNFDDMLFFKNKQQIVIDAGMEYIKCSKNDNNIDFPSSSYGTCASGTTTTSATVNYGESANVTCPCGTATPSRSCGKYGLWGSFTRSCS